MLLMGAALAIIVLATWATLGASGLPLSVMRVARSRAQHTLLMLIAELAVLWLTIHASAWATPSPPHASSWWQELLALMTPVLAGVASALPFLAREALDPLRVGFWHHRRLRRLGCGISALGGIGLALFAPSLVLAPLAFSILLFHRHLHGHHGLVRQAVAEIEALSHKVLALQVELRLRASLREGIATAVDDRTPATHHGR